MGLKSALKRIAYIDQLKGFAIILVVAGHVLQFVLNTDNYLFDPVWRYIYSFHMQLFIMLSGLTFSSCLKTYSDLFSFCKKRFAQLVIPFVLWTIIFTIYVGKVNFFFSCLIDPGNGYWFLWDLFFISTTFALAIYFSNEFKQRYFFGIIICFVILLLFSLLLNTMFDSNRIPRLFPFFVLGYYLKEIRFKEKKLYLILGETVRKP